MPKRSSSDTVDRLLLIARMLIDNRHGISIRDLVEEFGENKKRTLYRDIDRLSLILPIFVDDKDHRWKLMDVNPATIPPFTVTLNEVIALKFAEKYLTTAFKGTLIEESISSLYKKLDLVFSPRERNVLEQFSDGYSFIPYALKKPQTNTGVINTLVQAVTNLKRVKMVNKTAAGKIQNYVFEPYTLVSLKGGLYLVGRVFKGKKILNIAVERIVSAEILNERFDIPPDFTLSKHFEGAFGVIAAPPDKDID